LFCSFNKYLWTSHKLSECEKVRNGQSSSQEAEMGNRFNFPFNDDDGFEKEFSKKKKDSIPLEDQIMLSQQEQTDILRLDVDEKIMHDAILVASKNFLWIFRSTRNKIQTIKRIYIGLKKIMDENI
jgi:hypothetical protein